MADTTAIADLLDLLTDHGHRPEWTGTRLEVKGRHVVRVYVEDPEADAVRVVVLTADRALLEVASATFARVPAGAIVAVAEAFL